ncbi:MAG: amino acid adenylation domain-containing protein [Chloroflexi bacterium AL-W]|nr:amino acid adenylation domain-containing protein [Chloroflexi bacterium AL-N1]NOK69671.1 amino acid adenylation domain-containing protein [Chloroflexi bacterium AL-N10]NOK72218.1 amino acid adenylation domain-containing protein [Chloroflexi bacterium AL-N5]NOK85047.1 amino acid adenylation domain-containing protein [Chloroflexi bacterium AL-W]NOK91800.1 amino acid adenylation domain-containing protein [Chloroflexi bacterium AL-N15]
MHKQLVQTVSEQKESLLSFWEQQHRDRPDSVALIYGNEYLTYAELSRRVEHMAYFLQSQGVGPDILVGLCMERTPVLVIGLLGVLKAGGAYVPLDPAYPPERLAYILEDTQAPLLLTESTLVNNLPALHKHVMCLDSMWNTIEQEAPGTIPQTVQAASLAYVIYTSGSTGNPKGVAIAHHSVREFIAWACHTFSPEQLYGVLAGTSICFDLSIFELLVPLSSGTTVVLAQDVFQLPQLPAAHGVTLINTVPSAMSGLLQLDGVPASVRTVNLAGEPLPLPLVQQIYEHTLVEQVYNLYGPSEDTTYSTYAAILPDSNNTPPIGHPVKNTHTYVLRDDWQLVAPQTAGELYLGGAGLARGYLYQPALTAERFLPDLLSTVPGARIYRTGDRVVQREDTTLAFLGRVDHQVKIRGYRIELGEIESVLIRHPMVVQAIVQACTDDKGLQYLAAYVKTSGIRKLSLAHIRRFLHTYLPEYMLPSALMLLREFPLTPNGKVDRAALPAPEPAQVADVPFIAPRTPVEVVVAAMWGEALSISQIGVRDNFLDLGGHSLHATQVVSRVRQLFQTSLTVQQLLAHPTVETLADYLVTTELQPGRTHKIAQALQRLKHMSMSEKQHILQQKRG